MSLNSRARDLLRKVQVPDHHRDLMDILESGQVARMAIDPVDDVVLLSFRMRRWHPLYWWRRWWEIHRFKRHDVVEAINHLTPDIPSAVNVVFERFIVTHERVPVVAKNVAHLRIGVDHLGNLIDRTETAPPMSRAQRRAGQRFVLATGVIFATANDLTPLIAQLRRAQPPEPQEYATTGQPE